MRNRLPKQNLPLRVVLHRIGESTLAQYAASCALMDSPQAAVQLWCEVIAADPGHEPDKEHLFAIFLNTKLRPTGFHVVSVGSLNESIAHPREIFRAAIVAGAYAIILMHNHPSGDPAPSGADRKLTRRLQEAGEILAIQVLDHVIVGLGETSGARYHSFRSAGQLAT